MSAINQQEMLLSHLRPGKLAEVVELTGAPTEITRLSEMGLRQSVIISVSRGGITSIVHLPGGSRLCLRPSRDLTVVVRPIH